MTRPSIFIFGLGYTGLAFARAMRTTGVRVSGTVRSAGKAEALCAEGIAAIAFDGSGPSADVTTALQASSHIVMSISPAHGGDPVLAHHAADIHDAKRVEWIGYLSTVGVYGDHGGAWIDEEATPDPRIARAAARLEAEAGWRAVGRLRDIPVGIFRLAGIYGPGRNPFVKLSEGTARRIIKPGQVFNRIHVDDIVAVLDAAMTRRTDRLYNVADNEPAPPQDVITFAAGLMGVIPPPEQPFATADLSPMARSFYEGNRRIANQRIRDELGVRLAYPTYRDGLTALWRDGAWRGISPATIAPKR